MSWLQKISQNQPWEMSPTGPEYAAMSIDDLDRAAFGFARNDIKTLSPDQLHIKWHDDWRNAILDQRESRLKRGEWARMVDLSDPIDVVFESGKFFVDDGHHRFYAAKILGQNLNVNLTIKDKPHKAIVEKALRDGNVVPPEILAHYPDLAQS